MFIDQSMTRKVVTIEKEASILKAEELMKAHRIRHLPVVTDDQKLIGIVTDRDFRGAMPYAFFHKPDSPEAQEAREKMGKLTIAEIMSTNLVTLSPADTIQDALLLVQNTKVGALPVVDENGKLKGILSVRDLLRAFVNVLGLGTPGTLLGIVSEEKVGQMKKIVDAITAEGVSIGSILVARYWETDKRAVFPYLLTNNTRRAKQKLTDLGFELIDPMAWYMDQLPRTKLPSS